MNIETKVVINPNMQINCYFLKDDFEPRLYNGKDIQLGDTI